jgi:putative phosphoesterase
MAFNVGVIADTHGLLRPEAIAFLKTCDLIIHAGDIGSPDVLESLRVIGPLFAIRGNIDRGIWAEELPDTEILEIEGVYLYLIHNVDDLELDPAAAGFAAVISAHSHHPGSYEKNGVLYFNPGSAGPKRFRLPVSIGRIIIRDGHLDSEIVMLGA